MKKFPIFNNKIKENLHTSSSTTFKNGTNLLTESCLLYDHGHFARAISLAILGEEEFSKAAILDTSAKNATWNEEIFKTLTVHASKQLRSRFTQDKHRAQHINNPVHVLAPELDLSPAVKRQHKKIDKGKIDMIKQNSQFVGISKAGEVTNNGPFTKTQNDADRAITDCVVAKAYAGNILGLIPDSHPLLRSGTVVSTESPNCAEVTIIKHGSGVDVMMNPSEILRKKTDGILLTPQGTIDKLGSIEPKELTGTDLKILKTLLIQYNAVDQIKKSMTSLEIKYCKYLNDCIKLIANN